jgi:hypothetical protein
MLEEQKYLSMLSQTLSEKKADLDKKLNDEYSKIKASLSSSLEELKKTVLNQLRQ